MRREAVTLQPQRMPPPRPRLCLAPLCPLSHLRSSLYSILLALLSPSIPLAFLSAPYHTGTQPHKPMRPSLLCKHLTTQTHYALLSALYHTLCAPLPFITLDPSLSSIPLALLSALYPTCAPASASPMLHTHIWPHTHMSPRTYFHEPTSTN